MTKEEFQAKCAEDPLWFQEACLKVSPKAGGIEKFILNDAQLYLLNQIHERWEAKEPARFIVLKSRRRGISTAVQAIQYWATSTKKHTNSMVVSHNVDSAEAVLQIFHRFKDNDLRRDWECMPETARSNRREVLFDNPDWRTRAQNPGLDSRILIATADTGSAGRAMTFQYLHCSEVAFWPNAQIIAGILEALSNKPGTLGVLESTANGRSGYFYQTWQQAWRDYQRGHGTYWTPIFFSWKDDPECFENLTKQQEEKWKKTLTDEEWLFGERNGLSLGQMVWKRKKITSYEGTNLPPELMFQQEYPLSPEDAFVSTGRQFFDMRSVQQMEAVAKDVKFAEGWIELKEPIVKHRPAGVAWHPRRPLDKRPSLVRQWKPPEAGCDYVIGADVAMGLSGADKSVAYAMRRDTMEFVARVAGQIEPDSFADLLVEFAWYYNEAFLAPENNSIGMAVAKNTSARYIRHAYQVDRSRPMANTFNFDKPGWNTNLANRREMFTYLRQLIRDKHIYIWDEDFLAECNDFVVPEDVNGKLKEATPRAIQHKHDDFVSAVAICLQVNDTTLAGPIRKDKAKDDGRELPWREAAIRAEEEAEKKKGKQPYDDAGSV